MCIVRSGQTSTNKRDRKLVGGGRSGREGRRMWRLRQSAAWSPVAAVTTAQGRRREVLFEEDGFIGTQTQLPPPQKKKKSFSSDFGHFI